MSNERKWGSRQGSHNASKRLWSSCWNPLCQHFTLKKVQINTIGYSEPFLWIICIFKICMDTKKCVVSWNAIKCMAPTEAGEELEPESVKIQFKKVHFEISRLVPKHSYSRKRVCRMRFSNMTPHSRAVSHLLCFWKKSPYSIQLKLTTYFNHWH